MAIKKNKKSKKRSKKKSNPIPENQYREILWIVFFVAAFSLFFILSGNSWIAWEKIELVLKSIFWFWSFLIPFILIIAWGFLFFINHFKFTFHRLLWLLLFFVWILTLVHLRADFDNAYTQLKEYWGIIWFIFSYILRAMFWDFIAHLVWLWLIFISIPLIFDMSIKEIFQKIFKPLTEVKEKDEDFEDASFSKPKNKEQDIQAIEMPDSPKLEFWWVQIVKPKQIEISEVVENKNNLEEKLEEEKIKAQIKEIQWNNWNENQEPQKKPAVKRQNSWWIKISNFTWNEEWEFPSLDLLENKVDESYPDDKELEGQALNIQKKLSQFWIDVEVIEARVWPTVTQFTLNPAEWVKISKILSLKDDLAMALAAKSVRIEAPIPWQAYVWIEIPNLNRSTVYMREIIESEEFKKWDSKLKLCFWKDTSWNPVVEDLAKMPHMLIAWTTWSWKSVWMNTFLMSLMYQNSPKELKLIMIDPKMVELSWYNWCPHLLTPVITEEDKALAALKWSVSEMMRRYTECKEKWYRNIQEYNENEETKMPKIVIVIDELADLMMRWDLKKDTENTIARIAQMARAVWMHLIIATQKPTVNVVTWLIKSNIPTRICFTVQSSMDSRVVLDSVWWEDLLWMWDMMYINASLPKPKRVQWIFISSKEVERVVNHIKLAKEPEDENEEEFVEDITQEATQVNWFQWATWGNQWVWVIDLDAIAAAANEDPKVAEAIAAIQETWKASATLLQRKISVWYAKAAKILDILEEKWIVGPANWAKPREIYLDRI